MKKKTCPLITNGSSVFFDCPDCGELIPKKAKETGCPYCWSEKNDLEKPPSINRKKRDQQKSPD